MKFKQNYLPLYLKSVPLWRSMVMSPSVQSKLLKVLGIFVIVFLLLSSHAWAANSDQPRIVNIYNFIRDSDYRLKDSRDQLFDCTAQQIQLLKKYNLPATWALQYDALMDSRYPQMLKQQLSTNDEIAAWWEIPQELAEKAGIKWRGDHEWDPAANVGFSPGYTPEERRKLVDVYMADFKSTFGYYPRTVGSWFIDEVTLEYMAQKYGIVASCNCKDQIGTDFYTLWGGYWNQAYYPSRVNAYMPAQTRAGQIDVPVFRMLGSDPIYQHGTTPGLISLEPVYKAGGGGMPQWVDWFLQTLVQGSSLGFAYTQAGQENSFTWDAMQPGLSYQIPLFAALAKAGKIRVETLEETGLWFRKKYPLTPATSVVAMNDWKGQGHKTVWYDSRFYRLNILWNTNSFFIRDIHCFDENIVSPTYNAPLTARSLTYETLPIVDWAFWSDGGRKRAGMFPCLVSTDGTTNPMRPDGPPTIKELNAQDLSVVQLLKDGGSFSIILTPKRVDFSGVDAQGKPLKWAWKIIGGDQLQSLVGGVADSTVTYHHDGVNYGLSLESHGSSCLKDDQGDILLKPNASGKLGLQFDTSHIPSVAKAQSALSAEK